MTSSSATGSLPVFFRVPPVKRPGRQKQAEIRDPCLFIWGGTRSDSRQSGNMGGGGYTGTELRGAFTYIYAQATDRQLDIRRYSGCILTGIPKNGTEK
jgi:hypothetical protein